MQPRKPSQSRPIRRRFPVRDAAAGTPVDADANGDSDAAGEVVPVTRASTRPRPPGRKPGSVGRDAGGNDGPGNTTPGTRNIPQRRPSTQGQTAARTAAATNAGPSGAEASGMVSAASGLAKFRLDAELGRGGMGVVRAATDANLRRHIAIKFLQQFDSPDARRKFIDEAQITGQLQHPNIVPVYELGADDQGRPFMAMKRIYGHDFAEAIREAHDAALDAAASPAEVGKLLRRLLEIFLKVCDAVAFAHSKGVIHRDLKPQNVMVGDYGDVLVVDWGLAKPLRKGPSRHDEETDIARAITDSQTPVSTDRRASGDVTLPGDVMGTPAYMSPEQARGLIAVLDEGTDIFALGGILYTILTGMKPFTGKTSSDVLAEVLEYNLVPPIERLRPDESPAWVPRELDAVVLKAMGRRRRDRYATVDEFRADIERYLDGRVLEAADYTAWQRLMKWAARHKAAVIGGMSTLGVLVIGGVAVTILTLSNAAAEDRARLADVEKALATEKAAAIAAQAARERERSEILLAATEGRIDDLVKQLGGKLLRERDDILVAFNEEWDAALESGMSHSEFIESLPKFKLRRYIGTFDDLFAAQAEYGVEIRAVDWFFRGLLRDVVENDIDGAFADYGEALNLDPEFDAAYYNRALILAEKGDKQGAIDSYTKAIAIDPTNEKAYFNRGLVKKDLGKWIDADEDFTRAIKAKPDWAKPYLYRGDLALKNGNISAALDDFNRAIDLDPKDSRPYVGRGQIRQQQGFHSGALEDFNRAILIDPTNGEAVAARAFLRLELGDVKGAFEDFSEVLAINPNHYEAFVNRGAIRLQNDDAVGALDDFNRAIVIDRRKPQAWVNRGELKRLAGEFAGAEADFQQAVTLDETLWQAWAGLGYSRESLGNVPGTIEALRNAQKYCPDGELRRRLGDHLRRLGAR